MKQLLVLSCSALLVFAGSRVVAEEEGPAEPVEIRKIDITVFPHEVLVVRGKMVEFKDLRGHLAALVPDAKKPTVEVTVFPETKSEMDLAAKVIAIAKEVGYTKVGFVGPPKETVKVTEITILLSRTGHILVNEESVAAKDLKGRLEKLVEADRRAAVRVYVRWSRLVPNKKVTEVTKTCREAGFKDIVPGIIAE